MTDDIVARLWRAYERGDEDAIRLASYAADEITRLRADLALCRKKTLEQCARTVEASLWVDASATEVAEAIRNLEEDNG